ncbi:MAG: hypothetical protein ACRC33_27905 [Gemmataceae bacterium]
MAPNRKRPSRGTDNNRVVPDAGTNHRDLSASRVTTGTTQPPPCSLTEPRDPVDPFDADQLYQAASKYDYEKDPGQFVRYFEQIHLSAARQPRDPFLALEPARHPHLGSPLGLPFPYMTAIAHGVSAMAASAMKASVAFIEGVLEGWQEKLDPEVAGRLARKVGTAAAISATFPFVLAAGAAVGVVEDAYESVKGLVELIANLKTVARQVAAVMREMLQDPEVARKAGKEFGGRLAGDATALAGHGLIRFTFELGRKIGPVVFWTVLSIAFGIGAVGLTLKGAKELGRVIRLSPKASKALERLETLLKRAKGAKTRTHGKPDAKDPAAAFREAYQAKRFERPDVDDIFFPDEAKKLFGVKDDKWPDVLAKKEDGTFALGEGKGTNIEHAIEQFDSGIRFIQAEGGRVTELEVTVQKLTKRKNPDTGGWDLSPGDGRWRIDAQGYLEYFDNQKFGPTNPYGTWGRKLVGGVPVKIISLEPPG